MGNTMAIRDKEDNRYDSADTRKELQGTDKNLEHPCTTGDFSSKKVQMLYAMKKMLD